MAAPAPPPRPDLRPRRLAVRRAGLLVATEPARGSDNARPNRITVCAWHHLRGIHQGRVRAWGTAPDDVTWELGVRPGRAALLRLHGDEYVAS